MMAKAPPQIATMNGVGKGSTGVAVGRKGAGNGVCVLSGATVAKVGRKMMIVGAGVRVAG